MLTAVDITARKAAERRLRDIIETISEGLFIIDAAAQEPKGARRSPQGKDGQAILS